MLTNAIDWVGAGVFFGLLAVLAIATSPMWLPAALITGYRKGIAGPEILEYREFYLCTAVVAVIELSVLLWLFS